MRAVAVVALAALSCAEADVSGPFDARPPPPPAEDAAVPAADATIPAVDASDPDAGLIDTGAPDAADASVECPPGTTRRGDMCVDIDECAEDNGGCGPVEAFECVNRQAAPPDCYVRCEPIQTAIGDQVSSIDFGGSIGSALIVHGVQACPVFVDSNATTFVAAMRVGAGRVVEASHEGLLSSGLTGGDDRGQFVTNAVRWLADQSGALRVGVEGGRQGLVDHLTSLGHQVTQANHTDLPGRFDVFVTDTFKTRSEDEIRAIRAYTEGGGGLLLGGHAWAWGQRNSNAAERYPGNILIAGWGLTISADAAIRGAHTLSTRPSEFAHALRGLERLADHVEGRASVPIEDQVTASNVVRRALRVLPIGFTYFDRVRPIRRLLGEVIPTASAPVRPAAEPIRALAVSIDVKYATDLPADMITAHPAAADFPGAVAPGTPTVSATVTIDATYEGRSSRYIFSQAGANVWRSTGLYAPAGAQVRVEVPEALVDSGVDLQIGAHSDRLWNRDTWERIPEIIRRDPITARTLTIASAFGGLIYARVPGGVALGPQTLRFTGAVRAAQYVHGSTSPAEWLEARGSAAPWAELVTDSFIITVLASDAATLDDPSALMTFWNRVLDAQADLARIDHQRVRPERMVADRQISAGALHSGYPIMGHLNHGGDAVDLATLEQRGSWGIFHELGHNHQNRDWELRGTTEATVNLWSVYTMEHVVGLPARSGHSAITATRRAQRIDQYIAQGRNYASDWRVWTALETYLQLQEGFGWPFMFAVIDQYNGLTQSQRPGDEAARIEQWITRTSSVAGVDLVPFYEAWGWPVSNAARAATAGLPAWAGDPMRGR